MGHWLAGRLMKELGLVSCQQPTHRYKRGGHEHVAIPNHLERQFAVTEPNQVWCGDVNRPGFPGECFICELRLPDHRFRWKHNKLFLLLPVGYGPAFPAIVDCYTSPPT